MIQRKGAFIMAVRDDGKETRNRLLDAACQVFAEKGYRAATVAEICKRAGANVASVNYYFGDKATLYTEAWEYAFHECTVSGPPDPADGTAEERLRTFVHNIMENFMKKDRQGRFTRLYLMELANPTGLIRDNWKKLLEPTRRKFLGIIQEIMGRSTIDETVIFCEMSIMSQCRVLFTVSQDDMEYLLGTSLSPDLIQRLADHVTRFSLAGIRAVKMGSISKSEE